MLNFDKCITVFSYNGHGYDRFLFEAVSIFGSDGIEITDSGFKQNSGFKIRIPSDVILPIKCGDRVLLENADIFDVENAYTIMNITDNRKGNYKHYLLKVK